MEPIISPVFIYLIGISSSVQWLFSLFAGISTSFVFVAALVCLLTSVDMYSDDDTEHTIMLCIKIIKYGAICAVASGVIATLIPSKQVATAMLISSYVTPDNLHGVNEVIKANLQDYINMVVESMNKVNYQK